MESSGDHENRFDSGAHTRWFSRRALLLHLEVAFVAPGCAVAGWWQATRALAGNGLSWFYSVEWPVFALLAIAGWWYLIHEDPEVYKARKRRPRDDEALVAAGPGTSAHVARRSLGVLSPTASRQIPPGSRPRWQCSSVSISRSASWR